MRSPMQSQAQVKQQQEASVLKEEKLKQAERTLQVLADGLEFRETALGNAARRIIELYRAYLAGEALAGACRLEDSSEEPTEVVKFPAAELRRAVRVAFGTLQAECAGYAEAQESFDEFIDLSAEVLDSRE